MRTLATSVRTLLVISLLAVGTTLAWPRAAFAQELAAGAPSLSAPALRTVRASVTATWSAPDGASLESRLELRRRGDRGWLPVSTIAMTFSGSGEGTSTASLAFAFAGAWQVRHVLASADASSTSPWVTVSVAPERPVRKVGVAVFGDSLAGMPGVALKRQVSTKKAMVHVDYRSCSGLSRPDFFDWPARMRAQIARLRPDVVVIYLGANDWQNIKEGGRVYRRGSAGWRAAYGRRAGRLMDIAGARGALVYVVGQTISGRSRGYALHMQLINATVRPQAEKRGFVRFVDSWQVFATSSGAYAKSLRDGSGRLRVMRSRDNIHFSGAGASRMASFIRGAIEADWGRLR